MPLALIALPVIGLLTFVAVSIDKEEKLEEKQLEDKQLEQIEAEILFEDEL